MSGVEAQRRAAVRTAIEARRPFGRLGRRLAIGYLVALAVTPATVAVAQLLTPDHAQVEGPVSRMVEARCLNGRIQVAIDTGRADGMLLARDTGEAC
ncbi:hypothetical protein [Kineosporia sp. NBRC 101731]|uniref:hypothetical protein n=1 Tax=Kineosporia sp. NBRC 101731 TaxID=3032199 RepID=UPI0024A4952A|nr:hypothetical protein [Kineosporia sp. NBRC 101731]GLY26824.1 hypothetical protein Kisp02_01890 [Kineosporia sp. NBRC 101731]